MPPRQAQLTGITQLNFGSDTDTLRALASASGEVMKLRGVVDRDWRDSSERTALSAQGLYVLDVHEVENFLLHPETVRHVMRSISLDPSTYLDILRSACDLRAGTHIFDSARTKKVFELFPAPSSAVRTLVHALQLKDFEDAKGATSKIASADSQLSAEQIALLQSHLEVAVAIYKRKRDSDDLWKFCEGKEVFRSIAKEIGFSDPDTAERAILGIWEKFPALVPAELQKLRDYVSSL